MSTANCTSQETSNFNTHKTCWKCCYNNESPTAHKQQLLDGRTVENKGKLILICMLCFVSMPHGMSAFSCFVSIMRIPINKICYSLKWVPCEHSEKRYLTVQLLEPEILCDLASSLKSYGTIYVTPSLYYT